MIEAYQRYSILALERTFAALLVNDIPRTTFADITESQELERFIAWLIGGKMLSARLTQPVAATASTVLRFTIDEANQDLASEIGLWIRLAAQKDRIRPLMNRMREADIRLELGHEYVESMRRARRHKEDGNRDRGLLMRNGQDDIDLDEDIMTGMPS